MSLLDNLLNELESSNESFYGTRNAQEEQIYNSENNFDNDDDDQETYYKMLLYIHGGKEEVE